MKIESEKSIKSKEIHAKGKEAEVKLTEFLNIWVLIMFKGLKPMKPKEVLIT